MRISAKAAHGPAPYTASALSSPDTEELNELILTWLDDAKAEEIVSIDLSSRSSLADTMIVASGRANRHVGAIAQRVIDELKKSGQSDIRVEGLEHCNWVLIDTGNVIVHVFQPEVRAFYNLEKMWSGDRPAEPLNS